MMTHPPRRPHDASPIDAIILISAALSTFLRYLHQTAPHSDSCTVHQPSVFFSVGVLLHPPPMLRFSSICLSVCYRDNSKRFRRTLTNVQGRHGAELSRKTGLTRANITWKEAEHTATDRSRWRQAAAQCAYWCGRNEV